MSLAICRLAAALLLGWALAGCGPNPVVSPYKPDPTPVPIATPSSSVKTYYPENRAYFQYVPDPVAAKAVTLDILRHAAMPEGGWQMPVFMEIDRLTDADIIAELRRTVGRGVPVYVIIDDAAESLAVMQGTIDSLTGSGVTVMLPHQQGAGMAFDRQRARTLVAVQEDGSPVMMVYSAPMTPEALKGAGPAIIDLDEKDIMAQINALMAVFNHQAISQGEPQVVSGPGFVRNNLMSLLGGAKTSVKLQADEVTDAAVITQLGALAKRGLTVRVTLAAGRAADRSALNAAGVMDVRLATSAHLPTMIGVDGKKIWLGSTTLTPDALDQHREANLLMEQADIWPGAIAHLDAQWDKAQ